ncbi:hypothetical protein Dimus_034321 [Dionaea muscipula]
MEYKSCQNTGYLIMRPPLFGIQQITTPSTTISIFLNQQHPPRSPCSSTSMADYSIHNHHPPPCPSSSTSMVDYPPPSLSSSTSMADYLVATRVRILPQPPWPTIIYLHQIGFDFFRSASIGGGAQV